MSEKRYFKFMYFNAVYCFPEKICAIISSENKELTTFDSSLELFEKRKGYKEITEAEFLEVFNDVQKEITLKFNNQFSKENDFIKNESLKSEGY